MILVTGAGGHLGANLLRRLVANGEQVRALLHTPRDQATIAGLDIERLIGDLRDPAVAAAAVQGCQQVHHCAAKVSTDYRDREDIFACNVLATRHLLQAALAAGVEKVVVTGSFSAIGHRSAPRPKRATDKLVWSGTSSSGGFPNDEHDRTSKNVIRRGGAWRCA